VPDRKAIEVELSPEDALERVAESFEGDRGWVIEREAGGLLIYPEDPTAFQLDPVPDSELYRRLPYPETLAVRVGVEALEGSGARVEACLERRRVGALVREAAWQLMHPISYPTGGPVLHVIALARWRANRRGGKRRMLRLAIEPLLVHERRPERGPFRSG
jgi:hypothetical protein